MRKFLSFICIITVFSCQEKVAKIENSLNDDKNRFTKITLLDTFTNTLQKDTATLITEADFHPLYIGKEKDTIPLVYKSEKIDFRNYDWLSFQRKDTTKSLTIFVDTSRIIGTSMSAWEYYGTPEYRNGIVAYPVFIKNNSLDTLRLGYGEYIPLIMQAKNNKGEWKSIQYQFIYGCGTGLSLFYLPPKYLAITTCKLYKGDYKTKMRLRFGQNLYSNEFWGTINIKQFENG